MKAHSCCNDGDYGDSNTGRRKPFSKDVQAKQNQSYGNGHKLETYIDPMLRFEKPCKHLDYSRR